MSNVGVENCLRLKLVVPIGSCASFHILLELDLRPCFQVLNGLVYALLLIFRQNLWDVL